MTVSVLFTFSPGGLSNLRLFLSPGAGSGAPLANPAGYLLTDSNGDGRYRCDIPPYNNQQPLGLYWGRVHRDNHERFAAADWFILQESTGDEASINGQGPNTAILTKLQELQDYIEADSFIDSTSSPWQIVLVQRGTGTPTTGVVLARKELRDHLGRPVTDIRQFVASQRSV